MLWQKMKLIIKYTNSFNAYKTVKRELEDLYELQKTSNESHDYNSFLLE